MRCGKCMTEQNMERRVIVPDKKSNNQKERITYYCPNCDDQISPGACKEEKDTKPKGLNTVEL